MISCNKQDKITLAQTFLKKMEPLKALAVLEGDSTYESTILKIEIYFRMDDPLDGLKISRDAIMRFPNKKDHILDILLRYKKRTYNLGRKLLYFEFINVIYEIDSTVLEIEDSKFLGEYLYGNKEYLNAIKHFEKWLNYDSTDINTRIMLSKSLEKIGDTIKAYNVLKAGEWKWNWQLKYEIGKLAYFIGIRYYENGNADTAKTYFLETIDIGLPEVLQDKANFYMGNICYLNEDYESAIKYYLKVIELNPFSNSPLLRKAQDRIKLCKLQGG